MTDAKTAIAEATADAVTVRGHDLTSELMGHLTLTEMFFLLLMGRAPDERERRMTDACLVAIAEHGLVPSVQAARMTLQAAPESLQGAVAAGLLGCGSVILGATEYAGTMLRDGVESGASGEQIARDHRERRAPLPGFGHPLHKAGDPRTTRLLQLSDELGVSARARRARARDRRRRARGLRPHAAAQRLGRDRRADARPRPARLHAQGDPAARAHRRPARATCARSTSARSASASPRSPRPGSSTTDDRPRPPRRRAARTLAVLPRQAGGRRGRAVRGAAVHDQGRDPRVAGRRAAAGPSPRGAARGRAADLLEQRHHRRPVLHRGHAGRPRGLDRDRRALLRRDRDRAVPARGAHLQLGPVRGRRRARRVGPHRRDHDPGRQRQHRAARARVPGARRRGARLHAVLRALPRGLVPRARDRAARARRARCSPSPASRAGERTRPGTRSRRRSARPCARRWGSPTSRPRCGASARSRPACTSRARATSTSS